MWVGVKAGADVSTVTINKLLTRFSPQPNMKFIVMDLVEEDLPGDFDLILVRHLMYHLTSQDNLGVLHKLARPRRDGKKHYVMLSTHLQANENDRDYR